MTNPCVQILVLGSLPGFSSTRIAPKLLARGSTIPLWHIWSDMGYKFFYAYKQIEALRLMKPLYLLLTAYRLPVGANFHSYKAL